MVVQGVFYISENHFISMKVCLGKGSNHYTELTALGFFFIKIALEKSVRFLQVHGDSILMINWMKGTG